MSLWPSVRMRSLLGLAAAMAMVVLLSPTAATAAQKAKLKVKESCQVSPEGQRTYGVEVSGKGFAKNELLEVGFGTESFGDSVVVQADEKGRFGPVHFRLAEPPRFITAFVQPLFGGTYMEKTIERPCQRC